MGGHAAGEVASAIAVQSIRTAWAGERTQRLVDRWLDEGTAETRKEMLDAVVDGVLEAHHAIVAETEADSAKSGMGTTLIGAIVVGGDVVFAHCGDSRAYLVRDGIAMQLTEDQTLLSRLLAAGVDVDVHGEGARFKSMLTNAVGIGAECRVSTFVVPILDGDRFLLCSDGVSEYLEEDEIGDVLCKMPSPARAAQRLVDLALERGGADNATALVVRVLEAGETARAPDQLKRDQLAIQLCPLWASATPQQRLRALRIALPRDYEAGYVLPAQTFGDRVAWIVMEGELEQDDEMRGPGSLIYPEALLPDAPLPDKDHLARADRDVRLLALRADDFRELCDDDPELGEVLMAALASEIAVYKPSFRSTGRPPTADDDNEPDDRATTAVEVPMRITRTLTDRGVTAPKPSTPAVVSTETPRKRTFTPVRGSGLFVAAKEVEGDLERAMTDMTADAAKQLEPADNDDAEIVVESEREPREAAPKKPAPVELSEPEIEIERIAEEAEGAEHTEADALPPVPATSEPDIQIESLAGEADQDEANEEDEEALRALRQRIAAKSDDTEIEVRELEADEPEGGAADDEAVQAIAGGARDLEISEPVRDEVQELDAREYAAEVNALRERLAKRARSVVPVPPDEDVRELEVDEPDHPILRVGADEPDDVVEREWQADMRSDVKAAQAISALEAEEAAERVIDELSAEEPPALRVPRRAASEVDIEERHEVEMGELDDDDDGRVVEILKDTSSQTITMTTSESEPEIVVEPHVVADSGPVHPRGKRHTDTSE